MRQCNKNQAQSCETFSLLTICPKAVRVTTCPVSSDVILLLLILHYNGSLQQSLIYTLVYPPTAQFHYLIPPDVKVFIQC